MKEYLIAKAFGGNDCDFIANALVGLKVEGEFGVVAFDDDLCGSFDGLDVVRYPKGGPALDTWVLYLRANATHDDGAASRGMAV